jgi:CBS domain-containing protein
MRDEYTDCALLTRDGELAGIFTERDLVVRVLGNKAALDLPAARWMTPDPVRVTQTDTVRKTVRLMQQYGFRSVPVVDEVGRITGCVRHKDIINYLAEHFSDQVLNLPPNPEQIALEREGG